MYVINDIAVLKSAFNFDLFIISLDMGWQGGLADPLMQNFDDLARRIESHGGAMVRCLDETPLMDLCERYLGVSLYELSNVLPALLITDARPDQVQESSLRLVVPLKKVEELYGSFDEFLMELVNFVRNRDSAFLRRFEDKPIGFWDAVHAIDLKPNMFGIGININHIIDLVRGNASNRQ
jgi:hypothetical protein